MPALTNQGRDPGQALRMAQRARDTGRWPDWRWHDLAAGVPGSVGWGSEFRRVAENGVFTVLIRDLPTDWGVVQHAMITHMPGQEPTTWAEKQRIKDRLFGRGRTAIEVFPPASELVDGADAYHLWVLPEGFALPFNLAKDP
jgi:hypothetical protein